MLEQSISQALSLIAAVEETNNVISLESTEELQPDLLRRALETDIRDRAVLCGFCDNPKFFDFHFPFTSSASFVPLCT
jgi:hypothetical protein